MKTVSLKLNQMIEDIEIIVGPREKDNNMHVVGPKKIMIDTKR